MIITGGQLSMADINVELRRPATQALGLGDYSPRALANNPYGNTNGLIAMAEFFGKSLYKPRGTLYSAICQGYDYTFLLHDGNGGFYSEVQQYNSPQCGYVAPPPPPPPPQSYTPRGTYLRQFCDGFSLTTAYADGAGGEYYFVNDYASVSCGYVNPGA